MGGSLADSQAVIPVCVVVSMVLVREDMQNITHPLVPEGTGGNLLVKCLKKYQPLSPEHVVM